MYLAVPRNQQTAIARRIMEIPSKIEAEEKLDTTRISNGKDGWIELEEGRIYERPCLREGVPKIRQNMIDDCTIRQGQGKSPGHGRVDLRRC